MEAPGLRPLQSGAGRGPLCRLCVGYSYGAHMIKALLGNRTVLIGLSARNIEQLQLGKPILFDLAVLGLPSQQIAVAAGPTEDAIAADLSSAGGTIARSVIDAGRPERPTPDDYAAAEWAITQSWQGEVGA